MKIKQLKLNIYKGQCGGRRPGSGRKEIHSKGVRHRIREKVTRHTPMHINFKVVKGIPNLRNKTILRFLKRAVLKARLKGLRIQYYSLQSNHAHFIVEADGNKIFSSGMRALTISFAKSINGFCKREGQVHRERYHLHVLRAKREVKFAVEYVRHQKHMVTNGLDEFTSELIDLAQSWLLREVLRCRGSD